MTENWYLLDSGEQTPAYNMAADECLLRWHSEGKIPPVIRFYEWKPAGLSVGYFQKTKNRIDLDAVHKHGFDLVRRLTGGRAVLHDAPAEIGYRPLRDRHGFGRCTALR